MTISARPARPTRKTCATVPLSLKLLLTGVSALSLVAAGCGIAAAQGGDGPGASGAQVRMARVRRVVACPARPVVVAAAARGRVR